MSIKVLAEAIILQSIEDLWSTDHRRESARFFGGDGFRIVAEIAGLESNERRRIFDLVKETLQEKTEFRPHKEVTQPSCHGLRTSTRAGIN